jgi:hypothetical protein
MSSDHASSTPQRLSPVYPVHPMGSADSRIAARLYSRIQSVPLGHRRRTAVVRSMCLSCRAHGSCPHRFEVLSGEAALSHRWWKCRRDEASSVHVGPLDCCLRGRNRGCRVCIVGMVLNHLRRCRWRVSLRRESLYILNIFRSHH